MTDHTKALADAARDAFQWILCELRDSIRAHGAEYGGHYEGDVYHHKLTCDLQEALAAYEAANEVEQVPPTDEEIEAWRKEATSVNAAAVMRDGSMETCDDVFELHSTCIDEAVALMRRARPNDALLQAAKAVFTDVDSDYTQGPVFDNLRAEVERASKG